MLAEIFMIQLEAAVRASEERAPPGNFRFVPLTKNGQSFKDIRGRVVEGTREPSVVLV